MNKVAVVLFSLMVVACTTPPKKDASQASQADKATNSSSAAAGANQGEVSGTQLANQSANESGNQSVYFEFGKAIIAPEYGTVIQKEATYLKGHQKEPITVEGNCDERGSAEYNLALGQRRADAVKKLLVAAGTDARHIKATSLGKEKPKLTCHDESCWKENRRVDFVQGQ